MNLPWSRVGMLGAGRMGAAMLTAWCELTKILRPDQLTIIDPFASGDFIAQLAQQGAQINPSGFDECDVVIVAVKPQVMFAALSPLCATMKPNSCLISIAAGVRLADIAAIAGEQRPLVRAMPNTPARIGHGVTALYGNQRCDSPTQRATTTLMEGLGSVVWLNDETLFDAVTAVSGSGPAYLFYFVECMLQAAQKAGLPPHIASSLVKQTVLGAAKLAAAEGADAASLRAEVCSPGGTTLAGLSALTEDHQLQRVLEEAVARAKERSVQLAQMNGSENLAPTHRTPQRAI